MSIQIESKYSAEMLQSRIEALYRHKAWYSLPKGVVGRTSKHKICIGIENGIVFWLGRGKLEGEIKSTESGSMLIGKFNSPAVAIFTPVVFILFLLALMPEEIVSLFLLCFVFCVFAFLLVKADHSQLLEALNKAAGNTS